MIDCIASEIISFRPAEEAWEHVHDDSFEDFSSKGNVPRVGIRPETKNTTENARIRGHCRRRR